MKVGQTLSLTALLVSAALLTGCNEKPAAVQAKVTPAPAVQVMTLETSPITPYLEFIGRTEAANEVDLIPRVAGELTAIHFKDGSFVEKGQLLYEIDARPYEAALKSAEASLAQAQANLVMTMRNAERAKQLIKDKSISEQQHDSAIADHASAIAQVAEAEAAVLAADLDLGFTKIYAPFSGRAGFTNYKVGDRITSLIKNRLVSISQVDPMRFNFDVDEKLFRQIRTAIDAARSNNKELNVDIGLALSDGSMYDHKGTIHAISNRIDADTGSIRVQASFANQDYSLMPGEFGKLSVKLRDDTVEGILIPQASIQQDQAGSYVMVVNAKGVVEQRYVTMGQNYGIDRSILSGLKQDEQIVVKGLQKIRPGVTVDTINL